MKCQNGEILVVSPNELCAPHGEVPVADGLSLVLLGLALIAASSYRRKPRRTRRRIKYRRLVSGKMSTKREHECDRLPPLSGGEGAGHG